MKALTNGLSTFVLLFVTIFFSCSVQAQERVLVQFLFHANGNIVFDIEDAKIAISSLPGIEMSRMDLASRNYACIISTEYEYSESYFNEFLSPFGIELGCYQANLYEYQPIVPLKFNECIREIEVSGNRNGPCCSAHLSFGCLDGPCQAVVCAIDAFCCASNWDALCAGEAINNANAAGVCAGVTDCPGAIGGGGNCCTANGGLGCSNAACQTAICNLDSFCCTNSWDAVCAGSAVTNALNGGPCAGVTDCPSVVAAPCCSSNGGLGCENAACQIAVCNIDPFCCTNIWDAFCASEAIDNANLGGACSGVSDCPSGSGGPVTASDCSDAVNVCSNINFTINPNGFGLINEVPAPGSYANPSYDGFTSLNPWGTTNYGCLLAGELNSTWMVVNIELGGILEFTFGGLGTQAGFYDWAMWPYDDLTCNAVTNNTIVPIRCNWNGVSSGGTGLASTIPGGGNTTNYEPPLNVLTGDQYLICFSNYSSVSTNVPLEFYGTAQVSCNPILVLPVELTSFEAKAVNNHGVLTWTTQTETNNDFFILEKSLDASNWIELEKINGSGNSNETQFYEAIDLKPSTGTVYYRLLQSDYNGIIKELVTAALTFINESFIVYPNPGNNYWKLSSNSILNDSQIKIYNLAGEPIDFKSKVDNNSLELELNNYSPGIYFLCVFSATNEVIFTTKLLGK